MNLIVVDGRTDIEKLFELLQTGGECSELDFKETLDFSKRIDELDFVKDAVSMFNRYPGGYIVVGVDDNGGPSQISAETNWSQFDGAVLTDKIRKYVDAPLTAISQVHEIDGHTYCLMCFRSPEDGLPVPFSKLGQAPDEKGRQRVVFREGEFSRRDGAQNRPIEYPQWSEILKQHDHLVRKLESNRINTLVDKLVSVLGDRGKTPPLVPGMSDEALISALTSCNESGESGKVIHFINQVSSALGTDDAALDELAGVASLAVAYENDPVFHAASDALYDYYYSLRPFDNNARQKLAIVLAAYNIGAAIVMAKRWDLVSPFVNRNSPMMGNYVYASWLRDCQVESARYGLFDERGSGMLISAALERAKEHPIAMPDFDLAEADGKKGHDEQRAIDYLCSFDFLYCLCVFTAGDGVADAYPCCCVFSEDRIRKVVAKIFGGDSSARKALLPNSTDDEIADGLRNLYQIISNESGRASNYFWGLDPTKLLSSFLDKHPSRKPQGTSS